MLNLRQEVIGFLEKSDYVTCEYKGCFDIAAKKDALLLLKVLLNIDGFQREQAKNLKIISNNLDAHPFLIGIQTNREKLQRGIVYERYETPTVSLKTFEDLIVNSIFPRIYRDKGGLYVEIDSAILREIRKKKDLTQRELAEAVGINKKVIYEHEKKQLRMLLEIAEKIERTLNQKIIKPIEVFKKYEEHGHPEDSMERGVKKHLEKLGFKTDFVKQAPLDVFAKEKSLVLSDIEINKRKMKQHAASLKDFISVVKKPAILITEKTRDEEILGIPVIERKKLKDIDKKELIKKAKKAI
ncbi:MAG: helix-turn-helix domain-containing protein [Candidatus Aenigmarchaeota archaeon]|nr:helix-turn-helix domain-containing protein [Candidatus Aenigmarchaeota archaeon]